MRDSRKERGDKGISSSVITVLTMTSLNQMREVLLVVCSKMADEVSLSSKLPVADRTREFILLHCSWC